MFGHFMCITLSIDCYRRFDVSFFFSSFLDLFTDFFKESLNRWLTDKVIGSWVTIAILVLASKKQKTKNKKNALYLSVNVFSTKVLIGDTVFTSPTGDGTAI